jgi:hypothetical protein
VGKGVNLTGGAQLAVTEEEGIVVGLCKLEVETAFGNYAKAAQAGMGRARAHQPAMRSGPALARLGRVGRILRKNSFQIKIGILNLPRLWKFVEGDLGIILTWGFFLNSSRLLKDFRKI